MPFRRVALARELFEDPSFACQGCSLIFLSSAGLENQTASLLEVEV